MTESRLRRHRTAAKLTQSALAQAVGTSRMTISNIERGVFVPRVALAIKIAEQLGVCTDALFGHLDNAEASHEARYEITSQLTTPDLADVLNSERHLVGIATCEYPNCEEKGSCWVKLDDGQLGIYCAPHADVMAELNQVANPKNEPFAPTHIVDGTPVQLCAGFVWDASYGDEDKPLPDELIGAKEAWPEGSMDWGDLYFLLLRDGRWIKRETNGSVEVEGHPIEEEPA